jgi:hypothetical protein
VIDLHPFPEAAHTFVPPDGDDHPYDLIDEGPVDPLQVPFAFGTGVFYFHLGFEISLRHEWMIIV